MKYLIIALILIGCSTTREIKKAEYKKLTENICPDNKKEIILAQILYNKMVNGK